jgi:hypothetical protein
MPADLTGVRRKVARAKSKLDALSAEVALYLEPPPFRFVVETDGNRQSIVCHVDREPDESWADELVEIVYQARSALDQLFRQLIIDSEHTLWKGGYPIRSDRDEYLRKGKGGRSNRERLLKGVASRHRRIIDSVQPFQRGGMAARDPLAVLNTISNRDKHNDVYTCIAALGNPGFRLIRPSLPPPDRELTVRLGEKLTPHPMMDGEEFFALSFQPSAGAPPEAVNTEVYIEPIDLRPTLGFQSDGRVFTLDDIERGVLAVSRVIDRHAARLKP